jgi:hypothetical protein
MRNVRSFPTLLAFMLLICPDEAERFFVENKIKPADVQKARDLHGSKDPATRSNRNTGFGTFEKDNRYNPTTKKWVSADGKNTPPPSAAGDAGGAVVKSKKMTRSHSNLKLSGATNCHLL